MKAKYCKYLNTSRKWMLVPRFFLHILIFLLVFSGGVYGQSTWYSYQSGNWAVGGSNWRTWTLDPSGTTLINPSGLNPAGADNVVILNGRIVTIPTGEAAKTVASVTIQEGAVLDITNTTGHNFGANLNGSGLLRLSTATFPGFAAGTFVQPGGGTVEYRNMAGFTFSQLIYNNLILNLNNTTDEALFNSAAALTINGNLTIEKGIFRINSGAGAIRTVNCNGDVTVNQEGQIRVGTGNFGHIVNVRGNFINNNGYVNFTNMGGPDYQNLPINGYATVFFDNDYINQNITCLGATNGVTIFYRIVIDKGVNPDYTYILNIDAERAGQFLLYGRSNQAFGGNPPNIANPDALGLIRGTVRLGQNIDIPSLGRNSFSIDEDAQIWIDGATVDMIDGAASINNISLIVYGKLRMTSSTSVLEATQCTNGVFMRELTNITIEDGTLNATTLRTSYRDDLGVHRGAVIIRGGTINLSGITYDDGNLGNYASFMLPYATNVFEMSGGTMNINGVTTANAGQSGYRFGILLSCSANNINVTGGTVNINVGGSDAYINSTAPFYNLNVINAANNIEVRNYAGRPVPPNPSYPNLQPMTAQPLVVLNDFTLQNNKGFNNTANVEVRVGGDFIINAGSTYTPGNNTTLFNGIGPQLFDASGIISGNLQNLSLTNSSNLTLNNTNPLTPIIVKGGLLISSGCVLNDNGRILQVQGNLTNSGIHFKPVSGAGSIQLTGAAAQIISGDGNGLFNNLTLNKTGGQATLMSNMTVTGDLRLSGAGTAAIPSRLNIGSYNLKIEASGNIYSDAAPGTAKNFNENRMIQTSGLMSDGGLGKSYTSTAGFLFPVGFLSGATYYYMPADIRFSAAPAQYGEVTTRPVNAPHPLIQSANSLSAYWKTTSSGFSGVPTGSVVHKYYHDYTYQTNAFVRGIETSYVPGVYRGGTTWSAINNINNVNEGTNEVLYDTAYSANGDYTAGEPASFFSIPVLYSVADGPWNNASTWSDIRGGATHPGIPGPNTIVYIVDNHNVNTPVSAFAGSLFIDTGSTLDLGIVQGHNFASLPDQAVSGRGTLRIASSDYFPQGDFGDFIGENGGTVDYYSIAANISVPVTSSVTGLTLDHYFNLILSPANGTTINMPAGNLTIYNDLNIAGTGTGRVYTNTTAARTINVNRNFNVVSGLVEIRNLSIQSIKVLGDLDIAGTFRVENSAAANHTLELYGNLSGAGTYTANNGTGRIFTFFKGSANTSITGNLKAFYSMEVDKGNSQVPVLDVSTNITTAFDPALTLKNGTFRFSGAGSLNISTTAGFSIPSTACLSVANGTVNIVTANNGNDLLLAGKLEMTGGVLNIGTQANTMDNDIEYPAEGAPEMDIRGGILNVNGQVRRGVLINEGSLVYNQSGGTVNIYGDNHAPEKAKFEVCNSNSSFSMSNGIINIYRGGADPTFGDLFLHPGLSNVTNGTINMGPVAGMGNTTYRIDATCNLHNLSINGIAGNSATVNLMVYPLVVTGNLIINSNSTLITNNINVTIAGNFTNNGTYTAGTNTTTFNGGNAQNALFGANTTFRKLVINKTTGTEITFSNSGAFQPTVTDSLTINSGILTNTGTLNIIAQGNIINNSIHTSSLTGSLLLQGVINQHISGNGNGQFGNISINNAAGITLDANSTINGQLAFTSGNFYINDNLLTFSTAAPSATGTALNRSIISNGTLSDAGIRKYFNPGASAFIFGIGVAGKYTPVSYTITANTAPGFITLRPVNAKIPSTNEIPVPVADELQYYWNVISSGFAGLNINSVYQYMVSDIRGTEANLTYLAAAYRNNLWTTYANVDEINHRFTINALGEGNLSGEYTCGEQPNNFTNLPVLYTAANGNWNSDIWSVVDDGTPDVGLRPNGNPLIIKSIHTVQVTTDDRSAYSVDIEGVLHLNTSTGHNLGHVSGGGRVIMSNTPAGQFVFPGGDFTGFMDNSLSTVEYNGATAGPGISSISPILKIYQNLEFTGNFPKYMSSMNILVKGNMLIRESQLLNNVYNKNIAIRGNWTDNWANGFVPGKGQVIFEGTSEQHITPVSPESFYIFRINNAANVTLNGPVNISNRLYLTNGNINTTGANLLTLTNTSSTIVTGGSDASFVDGPLAKNILSGQSFNFPVGNYNASSAKPERYGNVMLSGLSASNTWKAQYFNSDPDGSYSRFSLLSPLTSVSDNEYWVISRPGANTANVRLRWDDFSEITFLNSTRVSEWVTPVNRWEEKGNVLTGNLFAGTVATSTPVVTDNYIFTLGVSGVTARITNVTPAEICNNGEVVTVTVLLTGTPNWTLTYNAGGNNYTQAGIGTGTFNIQLSGAELGGPGIRNIQITAVSDISGPGMVDGTSYPVTVKSTFIPDIQGTFTVGAGEIRNFNTTSNPGSSYSWIWQGASGGTIATPANASTDITMAAAGTYQLQVTETSPGPGLCTASDIQSITVVNTPSPDITPTDPNVCLNEVVTYSTPSIVGHTYLWTIVGGTPASGNGNSIMVTWNATGNGSVSVTETFLGIPGTDIVNVVVDPQPNTGLAVTGPASVCDGDIAIMDVAGSQTGVTYQLREGVINIGSAVAGTGGNIGLPSGALSLPTTFNVQAYNNGCSSQLTQTHTVNIIPAVGTPVFTLGATSARCQGAGSVTYTANATNTTGLTYTLDAASITGGNTIIAGTGAVTYAAGWSGTTTITASAAGCNGPATAIHTVTINATPAVPTAGVTTQPTCAVPTGTITVTAPLGAAYEYNIDAGAYQASTTFAGLAPGNHNLTTRLAASPTCVSAATPNINVSAVPAVPAVPTAGVTTQPTCAVPTGTITVTAPLGAAYEYNIDAGAYQASATFASLAPGNHNLTTRLAASPTCVSAATPNINVSAVPAVPAVPTAGVTTQPTCAVPTGTITVTAPLGAAYEYNIDGGAYQAGTVFAGLAPGNHNLTTRLAASPTCVSAATPNINVSAVPAVPAVPTAGVTTQPTCAVPTGTITVTAPLGAAYEYNIDGGSYQASTTFAGLAPGNHNLTTRLVASPTCVSAATPNINVSAVPAVPAVPTAGVTTQPTCAVPTGTITVTAPLGAAYEYNMDGGAYQASTTFAGLAPGNHNLTTRLAASPTCISAATPNINVSAVPAVPAVPTAGVTTQPTCAVPTGTITVTAPLGAAYEYNIDGGAYQASTTFAGLAPGNHNLTTRLAASPTCVSAATPNINVSAVPAVPAVPTAGVTTQPTCAVPTGTITVTAPLGAAYEYNIDGGAYQASATFAGLAPGNHNLTTRLAASPTCVSAATPNINVSAVPAVPAVPTAGVTTQPTCAVPTGTITVTAPLGAAYEYNIDGGAYQASTTFAGLAPGNHNLTTRLAASPTCVSAATPNINVSAVPAVPAVPTAGVTTQPTCAVPTGTITVTAPLGAAYEYNMDGGAYQASTTFAGLAPGNHNLRTRLVASPTCISAATPNINVSAVPAVPAVPTAGVTTQPTCAVPTGTITVTAPLGAAYEYNIDGGAYQASATFAGLAPGNHNLTTRLAASPTCVSAATPNINVSAVPAVPAVPTAGVTTQPTCAVPTGTITVTAPLGAAYEYNIDGGAYQASATFAGLAPGNHNLTTRLAASPTCVSATTPNINVSAVPAVPAVPTAGVTTQPTCAVPTGTITVTAPLGAAYEYNIDGGAYQAGTVFAGLAPGNHNLTTRLAASPTCVSAATPNINVSAVPAVPAVPTAGVTTQPTCAVPTGTITVTAPLGAAYEYNIDGGAYQAGTIFAGLAPGNHNLTTRLAASPTCVSAATPNINVSAVPAVPAVPTAGVTTQPTCAVPTGTITVTAPLGAAYEYNIDGGAYQASTTFVGLAPGNHNLTTRLAASPTCVSAATPNINVSAVPAVPAVPTAGVTTQPTCAVPTGTITVTAPLGAAYEYNIDGGAYQASTTFAGLAPGNHNLTTRLAASPTCVSAATPNINVSAVPAVPAVPTAGVTTQPTCAVPTGTITVTAPLGAAYEYNIDGGAYQAGTVFAGLAPGNHNLTTRLAASPTCVSAATPNINVSAVPAVPAVPTAGVTTQPTCAVPTGTITVTAPLGAAYEYNIDGGAYQASATFAGLAPGNHNLTTRLAASPTCVSAATPNINVSAVPATPAVPTAGVTTQPTCAVPTGTITVTAPLGAAYEYNIDGGAYQAGTTFAGLAPGNHNLTTRLAASPTCVSAATPNINVSAIPAVPAVSTAGVTTQPTCAVPTGTITVTAPLGAAYEYNIDGGAYQASTTFAGLAPGNHNLTTRLAASPTCVSAATPNINVSAVPAVPAVPTAGVTTQPTCAVPTGTITVTAPLGAAYEYNIDGGAYQASATFAGLAPGNHNLTTRLAASPTCISAATPNINVSAVPAVPAVPTAGVTTQPTCAVPTGTITVTAPLGAAYEYNIDGGAYQAGTVFAGLAPGNHNLTTRLAASPTCVSAATPNINVSAVPAVPAVPTAGVTTQPTCAVPTGTITVTAPLGAAYEYNIDGGAYQAGTTFAGLAPGNHNLTTRLAASPTCVSAATPNINASAVPAVPAVPTAGVTTQPTCTVSTGTITVTAPLGAAYEYNIDGGAYQASATFAGLAPGNHNLTTRLTASPTCVSVATGDIVINAQPATPATPGIGAITQPTCAVATGSVELNGLPASGAWTITESFGSTTRTGSGTTFIFDSLAEGNFTFMVTNEDGCSSENSSEVVIQAATGCDVVAGFMADDTVICAGESVTFTSTSLGVDPATDYLWIFGEGAVPDTLTGEGPHIISYSTPGNKTVQLIISNGIADTLTRDDYITVQGLPVVSLETSDRCGSGSTVFLAVTDGDRIEFSDNGGSTVLETDITSPYSFSADITEGSSLQIWARAINSVTGCSGTWDSSAIVTAWSAPAVEKIAAMNPGQGPDGYVDVVCSGRTGSRYYVTGDPSATYNWNIPEMGLAADGSMQIDVDWTVSGGDYQLELEKIAANGCTSVRDTLVLVSQPIPELGDDVSLCEGDSINFSFPDNYMAYEWQDHSAEPEYLAKVTGRIWVNVIDQYNCDGTDTVMVTVNPNPTVYLGPDTVLCGDNSLLLDAGEFEFYEWSTGGHSQSLTVYEGAGTVSVRVTDEHGCEAYDEIEIGECTPAYMLIIPNTFTPNGDGAHEKWVIQNIARFPDADIQVFDRWGRRVFQGRSGEDWDGTSNGNELPVETYYYIIDLKTHSTEVVTGTISLIR